MVSTQYLFIPPLGVVKKQIDLRNYYTYNQVIPQITVAIQGVVYSLEQIIIFSVPGTQR